MAKEHDKILFYKVSFISTVFFVIVMICAFGYTIYQYQVATKKVIDSQLSEVRGELLEILKESSSDDLVDKLTVLNRDIIRDVEKLSEKLNNQESYIESTVKMNMLSAGAVIPFNLDICPKGWDEYKPAYGRFIRGIDKSGKIDPDGKRVLGSIQEDEVRSHSHDFIRYFARAGIHSSKELTLVRNGRGSAYIYVDGERQGDPKSKTHVTEGAESRPINVTLLFCEKT
ncbi:hypothetical protein [Teredinibacter turnerae]|uniref:hypothetical protein n=1 Tax=Teredinibacter turnerae TaxID=2426 RepID=UPI00035EC83B|nr:hypothetical protein [Teredinibacter turnerae]